MRQLGVGMGIALSRIMPSGVGMKFAGVQKTCQLWCAKSVPRLI